MAVVSKRPKLNGFVDRVKLVGIELEGGWDTVPAGEHIEKDGSVKFPPSGELLVASPNSLPAYKGEITSKPLPISSITAWVSRVYPKYVNETCGLHVHMSFHHRINYSRLMTPKFTTWMVKTVREFAEREKLPDGHPQWPRVVNPNHHHCAHLYLAEGQVRMTRKDYESRGKPYSRYTFVNYCDAQGQPPRHTIEVRGLAMMDTADQATRGIMAVLHSTNEFLSKIREKERPERVAVRQREGSVQEFRSYLRAA